MEENKVLDEAVNDVQKEEAVSTDEAVTPESTKKKKFFSIVMAGVCVLLIAVIVILMNAVNMKKNYEEFEALCEEENYSEALELFEEKLKGNKDAKALARSMAEDALKEYNSGNKDFDELEEIVNFASEICKKGAFTEDFNKIKEFEEVFNKGVLLAEGQQYVEAAEEFKKIPEDHRYYASARYNLGRCADYYEDVLVEEFLDHIFKGDYEKALSDISAYKEMGGKSETISDYEKMFLLMKEDYEREDVSNYYKETTAFTYSYVTGDECAAVEESEEFINYVYDSSMDDYYDYLDYHEARGWYRTDSESSDSACTYGLHRGGVTVYVSYFFGKGTVWVAFDK